MQIGVPKEIKDKENRVALTPDGARRLVDSGHVVFIEKNAGTGSGYVDDQYRSAGAAVVGCAMVWDQELVLKIKEPLESEYPRFKSNILFTYLHLAGVAPVLTDQLLRAGTTAIAYETVENGQGRLPLLAPMSAVAGNIAANVGGYYLAKFNGGKGIQLGRVMGIRHGKVMVIGDGIVGQHAAHTLESMGASVFMFGQTLKSFEAMQFASSANMTFIESTPDSIAEHIVDTDLVVGAVLLAGARAPHVVTEAMVQTMEPGSVIVDVSIDQGGCIETSRPTSHSDPVYRLHDVIHYCVTNMPGAYPRTSTMALTSATLPYVLRLAERGLQALRADPGFARGLNTHAGHICYAPVAEALGYQQHYQSAGDIFRSMG